MSTVTATTDRRFHRAHVKPSRRRAWRMNRVAALKIAVVAVAAVLALWRATSWLGHAPSLQVARIVVSGNTRLSTGEVQAIVSGLRGESLLLADLEGWRTRLLASPWVRDATLRRVLPSTVEVTVLEREPLAIGRTGSGLYLIDDRGALIDEYGPQYADLDLVIVDGLSPTRGEAASPADGQRAALVARLLASVKSKPELARRISQVDVSDPYNATVMLSDDPATLAVGSERFAPRLASYLELSSALHERVSSIEHVDLRFENQIYVRPVGKTETVKAKR